MLRRAGQEVVDPLEILFLMPVPYDPMQVHLHHVEPVQLGIRKFPVQNFNVLPVVLPHLNGVDRIGSNVNGSANPGPIRLKRCRGHLANRGDLHISEAGLPDLILPQTQPSRTIVPVIVLGEDGRRHVHVVGPDTGSLADHSQSSQLI